MKPTKPQSPELEWRDDKVPVSTLFEDPYFSLNDGLAETRYVFLEGNGLPERFCTGFQVAELGFGTGLNLLATWKLWEEAGHTTPLSFTSFELFPMDVEDLRRAHAVWPELAPYSERLCAAWADGPTFTCETLHLDVKIGDARETLPRWEGQVDAWFLDGFSPARNPVLWSEEVLGEVAKHTKPQGTAATYSAAGHVRRTLESVGFEVSRRTGFGHKRHMIQAILSRGAE